MTAVLQRPWEGEGPSPWLDATCLEVREGGRLVSVAAMVAVAVTTAAKREIVGLPIGSSEAEPFWTTCRRDLARRGLRGAKLVISDAHGGLKAAIQRVIGATWQRPRVQVMRNALAPVPKAQTTVVAAIRPGFLQPDHAQAVQSWRHVADQLRPRWPKLGACRAKADVLAYMSFPKEHRTKLHSTDEMDKRFVGSCAIFSWRGRPRGEERRLGCERRQAAYPSPAGLRRPRIPLAGPRILHLSTRRS